VIAQRVRVWPSPGSTDGPAPTTLIALAVVAIASTLNSTTIVIAPRMQTPALRVPASLIDKFYLPQDRLPHDRDRKHLAEGTRDMLPNRRKVLDRANINKVPQSHDVLGVTRVERQSVCHSRSGNQEIERARAWAPPVNVQSRRDCDVCLGNCRVNWKFFEHRSNALQVDRALHTLHVVGGLDDAKAELADGNR
jgi:hypothetical protein